MRTRITNGSKTFVTSTKLLNKFDQLIPGVAMLPPVESCTPQPSITSEALKLFDMMFSDKLDQFKKLKRKSLRAYYNAKHITKTASDFSEAALCA